MRLDKKAEPHITASKNMRNKLFAIAALLSISLSAVGTYQSRGEKRMHRENGWYHIVQGTADSITKRPIVTVKDFVDLRIETDFLGRRNITGHFSRRMLQAWADSTEHAHGDIIALIINDTIITAPRVHARIESGTFVISTPEECDIETLYHNLIKEKKDSILALVGNLGANTIFGTSGKAEQDTLTNALDYGELVSCGKD